MQRKKVLEGDACSSAIQILPVEGFLNIHLF